MTMETIILATLHGRKLKGVLPVTSSFTFFKTHLLLSFEKKEKLTSKKTSDRLGKIHVPMT